MNKLLLIVIVIFLSSCEKHDLTVYHRFETIAQKNLYGSGQEGIVKCTLIYNSKSDFDTLMAMIDPLGVDSDSLIDFDKQTAIAVFDNVKGSGGYMVDIREVVEHKDSVIVDVYYSPSGAGFTIMTQPYHIVKISKTEKPFHFR